MDDRNHTHRNTNDAANPRAQGAETPAEDFGEAILSAYLDGECTASQQAQIEEQIAASAELRQLVDELRNVRSHLELLPQYRLEPDFAERVLRRTEQEVLVGGGNWTDHGAADAATVAPATPPAVSAVPSEQERSGRARPFVWTLAALAAAVLILITNREPVMRRDPIAKGPNAPKATVQSAQAEKDAASDDTPAAKSRARDFKEEQSRADTSALPAAARPESRAIAPPIDSRESDGAANLPTDSKALSELKKSEPEKADAGTTLRAMDISSKDYFAEPTARTSRASKSAADQDADLKLSPSPGFDGREEAGRSAADLAPATDALDLDEAKVQRQIDAAPQAADKEIAPAEPGRDYAEPARKFAAEATSAPAADRAGAAAPPTVDESAQLADQPARSSDLPAQANGVTAAKDDAAVAFTAPRESLRVVEVVVERDAWQRKAVETVFAKNGIALYDSESTAIAPRGPTAPAAGASKPVESKVQADTVLNEPDPQTARDGLEMLVVSATSAQIEATLGDFGTQEQFQVVRVSDLSAPNLLYWQSQQRGSNRGATSSVRGGPVSSGTEEVPTARAGALGVDTATKAGARPAQLADQELGKKLNRELAPDDQKATADPQAAQLGPPAAAEKSRELRDGSAPSRRAKLAPGAVPELGKEDSAAKNGVDDKKFRGRGATAQNAAEGSSVGRGIVGESSAAGVTGESALSEGDVAGTPSAKGATRALSGSGFGSDNLGGGLGGYGGSRGAAPSRARFAESGYGRAGYGRAGGAGFGGGGGATPVDAGARDANLPTGYGQRLKLHQSAELYKKQNTTTYPFGISPEGVRLQAGASQAGALAPEQVVFVFRVVDTPLAKSALERATSNAPSTSPVRGVGPEAAKRGGRTNVPVPAPTVPANSAR